MPVDALPPGQWVNFPADLELPEHLRQEGAYIPPPLPLDIALSPATYRCAAMAEHALGRLFEAAARFSVHDGFVRSTRIRDAQSSAHLSGRSARLTEVLVADLLAEQGSTRRSDLLLKITPYLRAYDVGLARVRTGARVDVDLLGEFSQIMTGRPDAGVLRTGHGTIGTGKIKPYLVTAAGPHLARMLKQWSKWAHGDTGQPRIAQLAIAHYFLEVLQPFPTANGHIARTFSMLEMVRHGLLGSLLLPLSTWLDDTMDDYRRKIRAVVDTGRLDGWVVFFATAVHDQALAQLRLIAKLEALHHELGKGLSPTGTAARVLRDVIGFPVVNHQAIQERYGVSTKYATDVTRQLTEMGVLRIWEARRYHKMFCCERVLRLLRLNPDTASRPASR